MKYGYREVIDLMVFDKSGKLVAKLDTLRDSYIGFDDKTAYVKVKDALLNDEILKFIGKQETENLSDYEKVIQGTSNRTTYVLGNKTTKECKLIGTGFFRKHDDQRDVKFSFEIPNAKTVNHYVFQSDGHNVSPFDLYFTFDAFNEDGDVLKIHIEN